MVSSQIALVMLTHALLRAVGILAFCGASVAGQTPSPLEFEVATIKPAAPNAPGTFIETDPGGRVGLTNMTVKGMIAFAWDLQPFQISGGPPWLDSIRYDVTGKPKTAPAEGEIPRMVQALLRDRFRLTVQHGTKELPMYSLVLARKDGKLGAGLTASKQGSCVVYDPSKPPSPSEPGAPPRRWCGNSSVNPGGLSGIGVPIAHLIPMIQTVLGMTVVDKTGLSGDFDIKMEWTPDELRPCSGRRA